MVRCRRPRDERGAVAIEAALVIPILLVFVFGIVEMATLVRDDVAITAATRAGGRIASAQAGAGTVDPLTNKACTTTSTQCAPSLAQISADAIENMGTALPPDSITKLWVYKANDKGFPGANGQTAMTCTATTPNCVRYSWVPAQDAFRYLGGTWNTTQINACANNNPDSVGVYIEALHRSPSQLFGSLTIDDHAVFAFEPLATVVCGAGQHP